jgi:hypothetical protein
MAILTAKGIAATAVPLLVRNLVLARTVTLVGSDEYMGPNGGTVTVRVRQPRSARIQSAPKATLTADDQIEVPVDVSLAHIYDLYDLSDQEQTYDLESFAMQITEPQVASVATGAEDQLAGVMNALTADADSVAATVAGVKAAILEGRAFLSKNDAPAGDRYLACGPDFANLVIEALGDRETANTDSALREAILGRLFGATAIESNGLDPETAVLYHRSGFVWANRRPFLPRGAAEAAAVGSQGVALRQLFQFDTSRAVDQSMLSTFAGAAAVVDLDEDASGSGIETENRRFFKIELDSGS